MTTQGRAGGAHNAKVMNRFDLTKRLVGMLGSMGLTIPIALGTAIAQPKRHVIALEGDGSLLMQLGCLATVAMLDQKNLTMVIWDNGIYQITGGQPTASGSNTDLVAVARGAGIAKSAWAADEEDFERLVASALKDGGPSLIAARIDDKPGVATTDRDPVQIRERFMRGLGIRR
jgi:thiamine pyrophosphate-dependent acetolactate synthase large subunit-like protein